MFGLEQYGVHWDGSVRERWILLKERVLRRVRDMQEEPEEKGSFWGRVRQAGEMQVDWRVDWTEDVGGQAQGRIHYRDQTPYALGIYLGNTKI